MASCFGKEEQLHLHVPNSSKDRPNWIQAAYTEPKLREETEEGKAIKWTRKTELNRGVFVVLKSEPNKINLQEEKTAGGRRKWQPHQAPIPSVKQISNDQKRKEMSCINDDEKVGTKSEIFDLKLMVIYLKLLT